jgi:hypothetical protein
MYFVNNTSEATLKYCRTQQIAELRFRQDLLREGQLSDCVRQAAVIQAF